MGYFLGIISLVLGLPAVAMAEKGPDLYYYITDPVYRDYSGWWLLGMILVLVGFGIYWLIKRRWQILVAGLVLIILLYIGSVITKLILP